MSDVSIHDLAYFKQRAINDAKRIEELEAENQRLGKFLSDLHCETGKFFGLGGTPNE